MIIQAFRLTDLNSWALGAMTEQLRFLGNLRGWRVCVYEAVRGALEMVVLPYGEGLSFDGPRVTQEAFLARIGGEEISVVQIANVTRQDFEAWLTTEIKDKDKR